MPQQITRCACSPSTECREAVVLWQAVNSAYETGKATGNYDAYDTARAAYRAHKSAGAHRWNP
jgi:hypothetical protein